ncbi:hypothetical protein DFP72DRAFT_988554 [Ephemerocybe angulata]|uniref:CBM1 domain-containing protein n=1 Tax=Ephemerocybe angulata TaxID=980116 RepID=A0A8H6I7H6_9AGAR|nr:hypothetical protein DFP72DRAFT_988554 [Tulosesus angulatus]
MLSTVYAIVALLIGSVAAQSQAPAYGQCGGQGWSGPTTCVSGYSCTATNQWYSQCTPGGTTPPVSTTTTTTTTTTSTAPTTTLPVAAPTGSQIRTVTSPVYHFYLQDRGGVPVLGPESSSAHFTISGSISLNYSNGTKSYLNVDSAGALSLGSTATTTGWGLEGDTIIIKNPRQLNFLACTTSSSTYYDVFLQIGNSNPPGRSCTMVTMHLPCLC